MQDQTQWLIEQLDGCEKDLRAENITCERIHELRLDFEDYNDDFVLTLQEGNLSSMRLATGFVYKDLPYSRKQLLEAINTANNKVIGARAQITNEELIVICSEMFLGEGDCCADILADLMPSVLACQDTILDSLGYKNQQSLLEERFGEA